MIERRQSLRVECELLSSYKHMDPHLPQRLTPALVRNISRGGVCLLVNEFIPIQCQLHFYIELPDRETIEVRLSPAWIVEVPQLGKYELGARFIEMSPEQEDAIEHFQYQTLLKRIPTHNGVIKDLKNPGSGRPGLAA